MQTLVNTSDLYDGWVVRAPDADGMNGDLLSGLAPQFESWSDANLHAALVVRHGRLVYERYVDFDPPCLGTVSVEHYRAFPREPWGARVVPLGFRFLVTTVK
jgi:hypothetical protein